MLAVFYDKCLRDSVHVSAPFFVQIVELYQREVLSNTGINPVELSFVTLAMVRSTNVFLERIGCVDMTDRVLAPFLQDLEANGEQSIISTFLAESGRRVRRRIIPFIFSSPLSLNRIDTITNNA